MNLANKITFSRIAMVPFFILFLLSGLVDENTGRYISLFIFIIASFTDFLDGYIARSRNMITKLGKFLDPLADKLLVIAALVSLVEMEQLKAYIVIIIISREIIVTGFRVVAASDNIVIAASIWGKVKTVTQMAMIIILLINFNNIFFNILENILVYLATIITIISGYDYIYKNKNVFIKE